jgi:uncharacterized membrane protein YdbT with pleckstrin-like domain
MAAFISLLWSWMLFFIPTILLFLRLMHTELGITDRRVLVKAGLFSTTAMETGLDKIQNVTFREPLLGKLFNYGTVIIQSGGSHSREGLRGIKNPKLVRDTLLEQMDSHRATQLREQADAIASSMRRQPDVPIAPPSPVS